MRIITSNEYVLRDFEYSAWVLLRASNDLLYVGLRWMMAIPSRVSPRVGKKDSGPSTCSVAFTRADRGR